MLKIKFVAYMNASHPSHGPQVWEWWRLLSVSFFILKPQKPTTGYRVWFYTRWGAKHFDLYFMRDLNKCPN